MLAVCRTISSKCRTTSDWIGKDVEERCRGQI
jgi:hypothetical protein